jgi:hypothetical protein
MKCRKCGRALKNPESIDAGIGPVCLQAERKLADPNQMPLFDGGQVGAVVSAPPRLSEIISGMVGLLREAQKALNDKNFNRRVQKVLGEKA